MIFYNVNFMLTSFIVSDNHLNKFFTQDKRCWISENVKIIPTFCLLFFHFSTLKIL